MSEREDVAAIIHEHIWGKEYPSDEADCCADALLASSWLAAHDELVRADERKRLAGEVEARAHEIYPEDIFRKPTSEDYAEVNALLQRERGHQLDGIAGDCYRHAHAGIARAIREGDLDPDGAERS